VSDNLQLMRETIRANRPAIDFKKSALLVIDMQEYQIREGSITNVYGMISPAIPAYYLERITGITEPNVLALLKEFRSKDAMVLFTQYASIEKDESDLAAYCRAGNRVSTEVTGGPLIPNIQDSAASLVKTLQPLENELTLQKSRSGAFINTPLDSILRDNEIEQIVIVGVLTNACVENTARVGLDLDYTVFVVDDACATLDAQLHENAIAAMEVHSINIIQTRDLVAVSA
jgi:nicotinamidase-related amidase